MAIRPGAMQASGADANPNAGLSDDLVHLVYELLDAHHDTARLVEDVVEDEGWQAHLAYLRDLQRVARELLAIVTADDGDCATRASARR
jgi:putative lipase involved disintegration of autophagic bodies